jgi:hypothetical protein
MFFFHVWEWRWGTAVSGFGEGEIETGGLIMYRLIVEMGWLRCMRSGALLFNMCFCIAERAFRDRLSRGEWEIDGLLMNRCWDSIFGQVR